MLNSKALAASASAPKVYIEECFQSWLYTGNGSTQTITNGIDLSGKGGLVWIKQRNGTGGNNVFDTARGAGNALITNSTSASSSDPAFGSFSSSGFSLSSSSYQINNSGDTYASWTFRKAAKFFDVVTFSKTTDNQVVNHNLGSTPGFVLIKSLDAGQWWAFHRATSGGLTGGYLVLNSTSTFNTDSRFLTGATSTTITVGEQSNGQNYVAYLFAHDAGGFGDSGNDSVVSCGSFTTDGSGNIGTVSLGWEPQWILTKRTDSTQAWCMWDSMRGMSLTSGSTLSPNNADAEVVMGSTSYLYPTATGFAGSGNFYGPNATVVYIAIRRGPMKTPTDATGVYATDVGSSSAVIPNWDSGFPIDFALARQVNATANWWTISRLTGTGLLQTHSTAAEVDGGINWVADSNVGWGKTYNSSHRSWMFRRAPGFMDVVAYTGTGSTQALNHNLAVVPELLIVKNRSNSTNWHVYSAALGSGFTTPLTTAASNATTIWGTPTSTTFTVAGASSVNNTSGDTYIAYLFATCPGVSKCFNFTGNGTSQTINCGFTAGAKFVLIKRTDSTGNWLVADTARGIVSGNDPLLYLNSTAAEITTLDWIDPDNSGFIVNQESTANANVNGATYIGLAIA